MRVFLCLFIVFLMIVSAGAVSGDPLSCEGVSDEFQVSLDSRDSLASADLDDNYELLVINPISSSDTSGLKAVLLELLGDYDAIVVEYSSSNGYTSREVFEDKVWICSFWMLALLVYCLFRLIGGWLSSKR